MNYFIKKLSFFALLITGHSLYAAKLDNQPYPKMDVVKVDYTTNLPTLKSTLLVQGYCKSYDTPKVIELWIKYFLYGNPLQYKNTPLPEDLSGQNLSGYDFTGCRFTYTNLTDTNLTNAILTNTTCDYQKAFQNNSKENKLTGGKWYQNNLPKDLKSIVEVYPKLNNNTDKVKLLQIACGFARLPFYESTEFYIKVAYWSSELWRLQQKLGNPYGQQLVCSLKNNLNYDVTNYCWTTRYQNKVKINATKPPHANFAQYLKDFTNGLTEYQCKSKESWGLNFYKKEITKNIEGLKAAYHQIKDQQLQQEACHIAHALSKSYQIQQMLFQNHYLFFQNRLIRLKNSVGVGAKNKVYYNHFFY